MLNEFRTQVLKWDKANAHIHQVVSANSGDSNGRKLQVQVVNDSEIEDLTGATLSLSWRTPSGTPSGLDAFEAIDATKGLFEISYTTAMLANDGHLPASLVLVDSTGRIESNGFTITVRKSNVDDADIQSDNSFTALTQALVRVEEWDSQFEAKYNGLEAEYATELTNVSAQLAQKATKIELSVAETQLRNDIASIGDGSPKGTYLTLSDLQTALPSGDTGIYITTDNGHWYYWNGSTWTDGGVYQSAGVGDGSVSEEGTTFLIPTGENLNLFDKTAVTLGSYINSDGVTVTSSVASESDFIPVTPGDSISFMSNVTNDVYHVTYWNSSQVYVSGVRLDPVSQGEVATVVIPNGVSYYRTAYYNNEIDEFMVVRNTEYPSRYYSYGIKKDLIPVDRFKRTLEDYVSLNNNHKSKYLSILGDSISTYIGWIPSGNAVFYDGANHGVTSVDQTWWKRLIDQTGMNLCVNNAWSGSRVTTTNGSDSAGCMTRATSLHTTEQNPDVIIVYLGINDFNNEVALGTYDGTTAFPTDTTTFREAYAIMLSKILNRYKNAEVYVCTLPDCERNGDTAFAETNGNGVLLADWNKAISDLADLFGLPVLEMSKSGLTFYNKDVYLSDNLHPNASGMRLLGNKAIKTIEPMAKYSTL